MTTKSRLGVGACAAAALVAGLAARGSVGERRQQPPATAIASAAPAIALGPNIPGEVAVGSVFTLPVLQQDFDIFSWNAFIALNWPPGPGNKDGSAVSLVGARAGGQTGVPVPRTAGDGGHREPA